MMKSQFLVLGLSIAGCMAFTPLHFAGQQQADAKTLYDGNCKQCHGVRGVPPKAMKTKFPKIATFNAEFLANHSKDSIVKVLTKGKNDDMKSFKDKLTPDQMAMVATYVHDLVVVKEK